MPNPIFDSGPFRRDLPEARDFEKQLRLRFFELAEAKNIVGAAALDVTDIAPSSFSIRAASPSGWHSFATGSPASRIGVCTT